MRRFSENSLVKIIYLVHGTLYLDYILISKH